MFVLSHGVEEQLHVLLFRCAHNQEQVDNRPDATTTCGEQLSDTHAGVAEVEAVDAETSKEERYYQYYNGIFHLCNGNLCAVEVLSVLQMLANLV